MTRVQHLLLAIALLAGFLNLEAPPPAASTMALPELSTSGVPREASKILADLYSDAAQRMKAIVLHPPGTTQSSRDFRRARAAQLIDQVDGIRKRLGALSGTWVGKNVPKAVREGRALGTKQAIEAGVRPKGGLTEGSFNLIDQRTVSVFALDILADLGRSGDAMADRAKRLLRATAQSGLTAAEIDRLIKTGVLTPREGETREQMERRLQSATVVESRIDALLAGGVIRGSPRETIRTLKDEFRAVHGETVQIVTKNGSLMEFDSGYYAEMVARTRTRAATVIARHSRLSELGLDLVAIVGRISDNFCSAFLGQVFSLSGKSDKYPAYAELPGGGPPFHPNCSKSTRPFVEALASEGQLEKAEGLDDSNKLLGMDTSAAQRSYKDLQLKQQVAENYRTTEKALFGAGSKGS